MASGLRSERPVTLTTPRYLWVAHTGLQVAPCAGSCLNDLPRARTAVASVGIRNIKQGAVKLLHREMHSGGLWRAWSVACAGGKAGPTGGPIVSGVGSNDDPIVHTNGHRARRGGRANALSNQSER